ncbi:MAG: NAD(P)-binding domain-containing protein [Rhodospirillales bacterium]|nr:NAD(P)-binding domain-containing protein [Rhodospirillales bacterium]
MKIDNLPVAVIGAGPVGLAAAAHLQTSGLPLRIFEAGEAAGTHVRAWGHVRVFSPWRFNIDSASAGLLRATGWVSPPADGMPTGDEIRERYLEPLAALFARAGTLETGVRVRAISRWGVDKVVTRGRERHPFALSVEEKGGAERIVLARAVIDASGTFSNPNPMGASGVKAPGEAAHAGQIAYGIPDVLGRERARYAGQRVLVIGGGHSAANVLLDLGRLAETDTRLAVTWAIRGDNPARAFGGGAADRLEARGQLGLDLQRFAQSGKLAIETAFATAGVAARDGGLVVNDGMREIGPFDRIVVCTGQRPDMSMTRELRLDLDPWLESARVLGPLIDPNLHSCGTVRPHGYRELSHPEPDYFAVGIKSYGRAPTFLMATGYEQVRSVVAHLAGDEAAANDVRLELPETGVCAIPAAEEAEDDCGCSPTPAAKAAATCCAPKPKVRIAAGSAAVPADAGCGCAPTPEALAEASCCEALARK